MLAPGGIEGIMPKPFGKTSASVRLNDHVASPLIEALWAASVYFRRRRRARDIRWASGPAADIG